jgi:hypothetical protein
VKLIIELKLVAGGFATAIAAIACGRFVKLVDNLRLMYRSSLPLKPPSSVMPA